MVMNRSKITCISLTYVTKFFGLKKGKKKLDEKQQKIGGQNKDLLKCSNGFAVKERFCGEVANIIMEYLTF